MEENKKPGIGNPYLYVLIIAATSVVAVNAIAGALVLSHIGAAGLLGGTLGMAAIPLLLVRVMSPRAGYICLFIFILGFTVDRLNLIQ